MYRPSQRPTKTHLVCIYKEDVVAISLVSIGHFVSQDSLNLLTHSLQLSLILPVQPVIPHPHNHNHKAQRRQGSNNTNLTRDIPRRLLRLESLGSQDIPQAEGYQCQGVSGDFLGVTCDVRCVPSQQQHECGSKGACQKGCCEKPGLVLWNTIRIEAYHQTRTQYGWKNAYQHDH